MDIAAEIDAAAFGVERKNILEYFYRNGRSISFKLSGKDGNPTGFVIGREGPSSRHAAEVIAENKSDALDLITAVEQAEKPAAQTLIILPDDQESIVRLALDNGFETSTPLVCMDYGVPGPKPARNYYGMLGGDFG